MSLVRAEYSEDREIRSAAVDLQTLSRNKANRANQDVGKLHKLVVGTQNVRLLTAKDIQMDRSAEAVIRMFAKSLRS